jgi:hypothetical protein
MNKKEIISNVLGEARISAGVDKYGLTAAERKEILKLRDFLQEVDNIASTTLGGSSNNPVYEVKRKITGYPRDIFLDDGLTEDDIKKVETSLKSKELQKLLKLEVNGKRDKRLVDIEKGMNENLKRLKILDKAIVVIKNRLKVSEENLRGYLRKFRDIDGFKKEIKEEPSRAYMNKTTFVTVTYKSDKIRVEVYISGIKPGDKDWTSSEKAVISMQGGVDWEVKGKWFTTNAHGVGAGFYVDDVKYPDPMKLIEEQIKVGEEKIAKMQSHITVPVINRTISPEGLEDYKSKLKSGKSVTFSTSGFGTWYTLYSKDPGRGGHKVVKSDELAKFFEVPNIWYSSEEMD